MTKVNTDVAKVQTDWTTQFERRKLERAWELRCGSPNATGVISICTFPAGISAATEASGTPTSRDLEAVETLGGSCRYHIALETITIDQKTEKTASGVG